MTFVIKSSSLPKFYFCQQLRKINWGSAPVPLFLIIVLFNSDESHLQTLNHVFTAPSKAQGNKVKVGNGSHNHGCFIITEMGN